jgi:hypothetical protein
MQTLSISELEFSLLAAAGSPDQTNAIYWRTLPYDKTADIASSMSETRLGNVEWNWPINS